jgi:cytochrome c biogenesis protein ResB
MRTVLYLFVLIAGLGWLGTLVPQGEAPELYAQRYGSFLGGLVVRLGVNHLYSANWFLLLLALLILSLVACSRRMYEQTRLRRRVPEASSVSRRTKAAGGTVESSVRLDADGAAEALTAAARRRGYRVRRLGQADGQEWLHLVRHRWSAWGLALAHYAVFLIAVGALLGVIPGLSVDRYINVNEGQTYKDPDGKLPFTVQLHSFRIERDPKTGAVGNYYSDISILDHGREAVRKTISVNHPLQYRHYFLSQASWGLGDAQVEVKLGGHASTLSFPLERGCPVEGGEAGWMISDKGRAAFLQNRHAALVATGFHADAERRGGQVLGRPDDILGHPAINLTMVSGFKTAGHSMKDLGWLLPGEQVDIDGGTARFLGATKWTGLGVRQDFGVPIVWAGFIGCVLGLMMIFYFPLQSAAVGLRPAGRTATVVTVAFDTRPGEAREATAAYWSGMLAELSAMRVTKAVTDTQEVLSDV